MMLCSLAACKKGESANNAVENENTETVVENQTQYTRDWVVMYVNEADVGTDHKKLANDKYVALNFGSKVTVKSEKTIGKKQYYKVQLPDTTEYWADKSQFAEKFIVIKEILLCGVGENIAGKLQFSAGSTVIKGGDALKRICRRFLVLRPEAPRLNLLRGESALQRIIRKINHDHQDAAFTVSLKLMLV